MLLAFQKTGLTRQEFQRLSDMSSEKLSSIFARVIDKQQNDPMDADEPDVIVINSKDPSPAPQGSRQRPYEIIEEEKEDEEKEEKKEEKEEKKKVTNIEEEGESEGDGMAAFHGS